jgi:hypothetical protein
VHLRSTPEVVEIWAQQRADVALIIKLARRLVRNVDACSVIVSATVSETIFRCLLPPPQYGHHVCILPRDPRLAWEQIGVPAGRLCTFFLEISQGLLNPFQPLARNDIVGAVTQIVRNNEVGVVEQQPRA